MRIHRKLAPRLIEVEEPVVESSKQEEIIPIPESIIDQVEKEEYRITKGQLISVHGFAFRIDDVRRKRIVLIPLFPYTFANGVITLTKVVKKEKQDETPEQSS
jgi:hypothetical protein